MKRTIRNKIRFLPLFFIAFIAFVLYSPMVSYSSEEYELSIDFSPNIINISSERLGDIRILTGMRYSFFVEMGEAKFIYFNECLKSVENIKATRDSLGNLILKFSSEDLLQLSDCLTTDAYNQVRVVITTTNGDEYIGEAEVYINDKKAP